MMFAWTIAAVLLGFGPIQGSVQNGDVKLATVDWGGTGPLMVFLPAFGDSASIYDDFAPAFTDRYHCVGLTRRGQALSGRAKTYTVPDFVDDIRALLDSEHATKAVLVGHTEAGAEMTACAIKYPNRIAGLVYLDAAYDHGVTPFLDMLRMGYSPAPPRALKRLDAYRTWALRGFPHSSEVMADPAANWPACCEQNMRDRLILSATEAEPVEERMDAGTGNAIMRGIAGYQEDLAKIDVPFIAFYVPFRIPEDTPSDIRKAIEQQMNPWIRWQNDAMRAARANKRCFDVVSVEETTRYLFIDQRALVTQHMGMFLQKVGS